MSQKSISYLTHNCTWLFLGFKLIHEALNGLSNMKPKGKCKIGIISSEKKKFYLQENSAVKLKK